jgi:hypothetical protein
MRIPHARTGPPNSTHPPSQINKCERGTHEKKKAAIPFSGAEVLLRPERVETPIGQ